MAFVSVVQQVVHALGNANQTQLINGGRAAAAQFPNGSYDTIVGPVFVDAWGERRTNLSIASLDNNGTRQVGILIQTMRC